MAPKLSRRYCKLCFEKTSQKYRMEETGDMERCPRCGAEFSVNTGALLNRTALERAEKDGSPRVISRRVIHYHKRPPSSMDPVRFRTRGSGMGMGSARGSEQDGLDTWKAPTPVRKVVRRIPCQSVGRFPLKPEFDIFHDQKSYQITITLPYHKNLEDVRCEVINGTLVVESLLDGFDFLQKFPLPEDVLPSSLKTSLKNIILDICFSLKKEERSESEEKF